MTVHRSPRVFKRRTPVAYNLRMFDQFRQIGNKSDLLGLAWLCEQAGSWRAHVGDDGQARQLFDDAAALRAAAGAAS